MRIAQIEVRAFRGLLKRTVIPFTAESPSSLAVFAPNACGKSTIVDAIEFFLSDDGLLERLAKRRSDTTAGREAIRNARAQASDLPAYVEMQFIDGATRLSDRRECLTEATPLPAAAKRVRDAAVVQFIIRGHQLRAFVERQSAEERYEEFARWFGFDGLVIRASGVLTSCIQASSCWRMSSLSMKRRTLKKLPFTKPTRFSTAPFS
ncbi:MAG: AAA family ATPase [Planctomycetes bacterium]|nr:AAA family ATPase [Planctomycetota bacterium]